MGCSRQEYWSGLPFPTPRDLPDPGIEPAFPVSLALAGGFFTTAPPVEDDNYQMKHFYSREVSLITSRITEAHQENTKNQIKGMQVLHTPAFLSAAPPLNHPTPLPLLPYPVGTQF